MKGSLWRQVLRERRAARQNPLSFTAGRVSVSGNPSVTHRRVVLDRFTLDSDKRSRKINNLAIMRKVEASVASENTYLISMGWIYRVFLWLSLPRIRRALLPIGVMMAVGLLEHHDRHAERFCGLIWVNPLAQQVTPPAQHRRPARMWSARQHR